MYILIEYELQVGWGKNMMIPKEKHEFKGEVVEKLGENGNHCTWGKSIILEKRGVGQKYHILGKYTPLGLT